MICVCPESDTLSLFKIREKENINALSSEKDSYWYSSVNIGCKKITHSKLLIILNISVLVLTIFSIILMVLLFSTAQILIL